MSYSPKLSDLIDNTEEEWGNREKNLESLLYYGINHIDQALYGINTEAGEYIGIQAQEKNRKTTTLLNILFAIASQLLEKNYWVCVDTLESGMPPNSFRDSLIAMSATRLLIAEYYGTDRNSWPSFAEIQQNLDLSDDLHISREFLWYGSPSLKQHQYIQSAKKTLRKYPISLFGPSAAQGFSRNLEETMKRWDQLYNGEYPGMEGLHHRVFASDNVQLYYGFGSDKYGQLETVVATHANFLVTHPNTVIIDISQIGKTTMVNAKMGLTQNYAKGGGALASECTVLFETEYDPARPEQVIIKSVRTRKRPPPDVIQEVEPESGAFLAPARVLG